MILDANRRVGDAWRRRWDSLRLFTPARYDGLAGFPFPAPAHSFPTKDQVADYLEAYAPRFQLHSAAYRNPSQLRDGGVLVVGAGNSGAGIALEVAGRHPTWLAGKESGHVPFRIEGAAPLVRVKPRDLTAAGVRRVPRVVGACDGHPLPEDRRTLEVANVVWCTGSGPALSFIDLPVFGDHEHEPVRDRGVVTGQPGPYLVGLSFLYAMSSGFLPGVDRDAEHVVQAILASAGRTSSRPGTAGDGARRPMRAR